MVVKLFCCVEQIHNNRWTPQRAPRKSHYAVLRGSKGEQCRSCEFAFMTAAAVAETVY